MFTDFRREEPGAMAERLERRPIPNSIYDLLSDTASRHPDGKAWHFIDSGVSRTWGSVLAAVNATAAAFASIGIAAGTHVAIMAPNVEEFPLTWLALGRLGAVMVPVNTRYTAPEVEYILSTSEASYVVIHAQFAPVLAEMQKVSIHPDNVIVVGEAVPGFRRSWTALMDDTRGRQPPPARLEPGTLVNIQYTSGTTGFSKGCLLSHEYWLILGLTSINMFACDLHRFYTGSSFYYMVPQRILMNAMFAGGCLYLPEKPAAKRFMADAIAHECDYAHVFHAVYKQPLDPSERSNKLKLTSMSGFPAASRVGFQAQFDVVTQDFYGMTEIGGALYMPAHRIVEMTNSNSCGMPLPFREVKIADETGRPVRPGDTGEVMVRGAGLLRGYYGNPEATAATFQDGWFKTGDLANVDSAGYHYIVGRTKDMIRRSGENISAREVEVALRMLSEIHEVAVVPVPDDYRGEEPKAYVQLAPGVSPEQLTPDMILDHCAKHLAAFKIPRYIEFRESFQLTDSLKVQKKVLLAEKADLRRGSYDRDTRTWR